MDGCLRSLDNIMTDNIYGSLANRNAVVYPSGTISDLALPLDDALLTMELVTYANSNYLVVDGVARQIDSLRTAQKNGYNLENSRKI